MRKFYQAAMTVLLLILLGQPAAGQNQKPVVVTTFSILEDMTKNVGQDLIDLSVIVGPNTDMHDFTILPQHIQQLAKADVLIANGLEFEPWLDALVKAADFKGTVVIASTRVRRLTTMAEKTDPTTVTAAVAANAADAEGEENHDHQHGRFDPHAWHNLDNARIYVANIAKALVAVDPANAKTYNANAIAYRNQLRQAQSDAVQLVRNIPDKNRWLVTNHDGLQYFARARGFRYVNIIGSGGAETASAQKMAEVIELIKQKNIRGIFSENVRDNRALEQIARETGVPIAGQLFTDALGTEKGVNDSLLAIYQHNVKTIAATLGAGS